jgi:hypothetical protein
VRKLSWSWDFCEAQLFSGYFFELEIYKVGLFRKKRGWYGYWAGILEKRIKEAFNSGYNA